MYCPKCGTENPDGAGFCSKCGAPMSGQPSGQAAPNPAAPNPATMAIYAIPSYLVQAILVTLFCCLPFGIVAIVKAAGVSKWQGLGNYEMALKASNEAKTWCWVSFGSFFIVAVLYIVFVILLGAAGVMAGMQQ